MAPIHFADNDAGCALNIISNLVLLLQTITVVRISIGNGTFGGATTEKPVYRLVIKFRINDYVGDATQYP